MTSVKQALAVSAKVASKFSFRYLSLAITGWVVSIIVVLVSLPELFGTFPSGPGIHSAHAGFLGAIFAFFFLFLYNPVGMFLLVMLPVGFPILYHMAAMKSASSHALSYIIRTQKSFVVEYAAAKCTAYLNKKGILNPAQASAEQIKDYVQKLLGMNRAYRMGFRMIADKLPMGDMLHEAVTGGEVSWEGVANKYIDDKFAPSKPIMYIIVLLVHIALFVTVKVVY